MRSHPHLLPLLPLLLLAVLAAPGAAQPDQVAYQGRLEANGQLHTGTAWFKFAIVDGGTTLWSHDGSSTTGDEPATALALATTEGVFSVRLGDTGAGQVALGAPALSASGDAVLRVWVDTGSGFEQLTDQPLSSAPFALQSDAARRSLGDFQVGGKLTATSEVQVGTVLRFPDDTTMATAATGGGADADWVVDGDDLYSAPTGNVGIGTATPLERLHVDGSGRFDFANGRIEITTPGGWVGLVGYGLNGHRRDVIVDDNGIRLLAGTASTPPPGTQGLLINEQGWTGLGTLPSSQLDVVGVTRTDDFRVDTTGTDLVQMVGSATEGGVASLHGPGGLSDPGLRLQGNSPSTGGALVHLNNAAGEVTLDLQGDQSGGGAIYVGDGGSLGAAIRGVGGKLQGYNNSGTLTFEAAGQAFSSGSQTRMYDGNAALAQEWTAANREWKVFDDAGAVQIRSAAATSGGEMFFYQKDGQNGVVVDGDAGGDGEIAVYDASGTRTVQIVGQDSGGNGRVVTDILEIRGGADLSENFDINAARVEPGMVVCIDPSEPGKLVVSDAAYARTVAGIVSGAGGVRPGMLLGQDGSIADGAHPVALTGRVWTRCDASAGPIRPGDLLTTSPVTGHAMRVDDHDRAQGAVLGKAMSSLESGRGLVLVLVSLQ